MKRRTSPLILAASLTAVVSGCAHGTVTCPPPRPLAAAPARAVDVTFLGSGGFLVQHGADVLLFGPFFTNPTIGELATQDIHSDPARIRAFLPAAAKEARAIVVGHAHYDHLMDVPYIAVKVATGATIYASDAAGKVLAPFAPELAPHRIASVETRPGCAPADEPCPIDIPGAALRIWPIRSEHSAQFRGKWPFKGLIPPFTLWRGEPLKPLTAPPTRAGQWPEGTTFAYLVDLLEAGQPVFRIYYQDSGTRAPIGHPPAALLRDKGVDLALVCVGGYFTIQKPHHPEALLDAIQPRFVIASHWEDFFSPRTIPVPGAPPAPEKLHVLPNHSTKTFMRRVRGALDRGARACLACPGLKTRFVRSADGSWTIAEESGGGWDR